jgi:hypothetical protein
MQHIHAVSYLSFHTTIPMSNNTLTAFNPFALSSGSKQDDHLKMQEVIYYGESRFRQALIKISTAHADLQRWMQKWLQTELVGTPYPDLSVARSRSSLQLFVMSFLGTATATGVVVEVPIILRSLADSLAHQPYEDLPLLFHPDLLATLDAGTDLDNYGSLVERYEFDWWNLPQEPTAEACLNTCNLDRCLLLHRQLLSQQNKNPFPPIQTTTSTTQTTADPRCSRCTEYQAIAGSLLAELQGVQEFAQAMETYKFNQLDVDTRRATGLFMLHEKALLKEMTAPATATAPASAATSLLVPIPPSPPKRAKPQISRKSRRIMASARAQLESLDGKPAGSYKWTWGADLTEDDVLAINRELSLEKPGRHSGYNISLPPGVIRGDWSTTGSLRTGPAVYDTLPSDLMSIPEMAPLPLPPYAVSNVDRISVFLTGPTPYFPGQCRSACHGYRSSLCVVGRFNTGRSHCWAPSHG